MEKRINDLTEQEFKELLKHKSDKDNNIGDDTFEQVAITSINGSNLIITSSKNTIKDIHGEIKSILKNKDVRKMVGLSRSKFDGGKYLG